jgi:fibronectin type 3 domain-containing protein
MSSDRLKSKFHTLIVIFAILACLVAASSRAATLVWDPNPEPDVIGYKVYYSDASSGASGVWLAGTSCQFPLNLQPGHSYVFSVTAYNQNGIESAPSESVRYAPPSEALLVTWDPSLDSSVTNYTLSFGQLNQTADSLDAGNVTEVELANVVRGLSYFFYVTASTPQLAAIESWQQVTVTIPLDGALPSVHIPRLNQAPQVSLLSPVASSIFTAPATIALEATALDPDGSIALVEFFAGSTRLFTRTVAPYSGSWSNVAAGTYQLSAVATDSQGAATRSASVSVTVRQPLPAAPANFVAAPSDGLIQLTWADQSNNETGFKLYRSSGGSSFALIATLGQNVQSYSNSGLVPGTTYTYRLTAYNSTGESAAVQAFATTPQISIPPPATVSATPVAGGISISWSLSSGASQYIVQRALSESGTFTTLVTTQSSPYTDTSVTTGITYFYRVIAEGSGFQSQPSAVVSATLTESAPAAPTSLVASASKGQISLRWRDNSSNESGFAVERSTDGFTFSTVKTLPSNTVSAVDTSIFSKRRYYYRIRSWNAAGNSYSPVVYVRSR